MRYGKDGETAMLLTPSSPPNPPTPAMALDAGTGLLGSAMSMTWMPSSSGLATIAYVGSVPTTMTSPAPSSASNPPAPSNTLEAGIGLVGSVMSIIWTPSSPELATTAYERPAISAVAMPLAPSSASNMPKPSATGSGAFALLGTSLSAYGTHTISWNRSRHDVAWRASNCTACPAPKPPTMTRRSGSSPAGTSKHRFHVLISRAGMLGTSAGHDSAIGPSAQCVRG